MTMDDFHSEWVDCPEDSSIYSTNLVEVPTLGEYDEDVDVDSKLEPELITTPSVNPTESPTFSRDSNESLLDDVNTKNDRNEEPPLRTSLFNASLAKRRLQAYSKQIRKSPVKEERPDAEEKRQKAPTKKTKKALYPDEKAKAVIQEIEEIKRQEIEKFNRRVAVSNAIKTINLSSVHQNLQSPDQNQQFKKREIKQRNYRRTDSNGSRKSPSPEESKGKGRSSPVSRYPKDWSEYKSDNLTINKEDNFKYFSKKGFNVGLLEKLYNFSLPSPPIEVLKIGSENGTKEIPYSFVRVTRTRPCLMYSVNPDRIIENYMSRDQLFGIISDNRRKLIKDLFNNNTKIQPANKKIQSQSWYNKLWKKPSMPECKVLENSVGLSFLQNYSDEEDDETEEILICSSIKKTKIPSPVRTLEEIKNSLAVAACSPQPQESSNTDNLEPEEILAEEEELILTPERNPHDASARYNSEEDNRDLTPEIPPIQPIKTQKSETSDKMSDNPDENKSDSSKRKKSKRKIDNVGTDKDSPKKKKKKKNNRKKHYSDNSDESEDDKKRRKKQKKLKTKQKPPKKKNKRSKSVSNDRLKKKIDLYEQINLKKKHTKKKRKKSTNLNAKSPIMDDLRKKLKKKARKKKREADDRLNSKKEIENYEKSTKTKDKTKTHDEIKLKKIKKRKIKQEREDDTEINYINPNEQYLNIVIKQEPEDDFPIEKDIIEEPKPKTPGTDEYKCNWEHEVDQVWESEEENHQKPARNTSWESDEESCVVENRPTENRPAEKMHEMLDLEIPLNIKPFKKREISEELIVPEIKVKKISEVSKKDIQEPSVTVPKQKSERKISEPSLLTENLDLQLPNFQKTKTEKELIDKINEVSKQEIPTDDVQKEKPEIEINKTNDVITKEERPASSRWDKKELRPKLEKQASKTEPTTLNNPDTSITILENEYEEFMKAVSSNTNTATDTDKKDIITLEDSKNFDKNREENKEEISSENIVISPKNIPFIPMPDEIPIPSPNVSKIASSKIEKTNDDKLEAGKNVSPKKFSFTSIVLPSKRTLLNNSNLKLGDSDDESQSKKCMKPIEDVRKELVVNPIEVIRKELMLPPNTDDLIQHLKDNQYMYPETKKPSVEKERYRAKSRSPVRRHDDRSKRRHDSPRRESDSRHRRRESPSRRRGYSPRREFSPRRKRKSPDRYRDKGRSSTNQRYSSRRSPSPSRRRRSHSRSPRRSISPRDRTSKMPSRIHDVSERLGKDMQRRVSSPLEGLKRSVADSTISDDSLLPLPNLDEYAHSSPAAQPYFDRMKFHEPKRISLDERINLELGFHKDVKPISTTYNNFSYNNYPPNCHTSTPLKVHPSNMENNMYGNMNVTSNFVQIGNMVEIVPTDLNIKVDIGVEKVRHENKSQILQVGNMLQIVPTEIPPEIPLPPLPPLVSRNENVNTTVSTSEKPSAEMTMKQKIAERRAEREKRKQEREKRRKDKENRRREKEKLRQIKMKQKTENMIKRALQLEVEGQDAEDPTLDITPTQWPPILNVSGTSKDLFNKSILVRCKRNSSKSKRKNVKFADGVKPGDGTSPSGGEELTSPSPCKVLPKEKRYSKTKLRIKNNKKKVKVKIIKPSDQLTEESEEDDHLPPPSPPPGSPPPHIFPPRIKPSPNNTNHHQYVPNVVVNQNHALYRSPLNMVMMSHHQQPPPLPDSPMQVHPFVQYKVPPLPPAPPPPERLDPSATSVHRNHHFNY